MNFDEKFVFISNLLDYKTQLEDKKLKCRNKKGKVYLDCVRKIDALNLVHQAILGGVKERHEFLVYVYKKGYNPFLVRKFQMLNSKKGV